VSEQLNPEAVEWDVVIAGTGMGGGTLGYALAREGRRVLFLEKGLATYEKQNADILFGHAPEDVCDLVHAPEAGCRERLLRAGRSPDRIDDCTTARTDSFYPDLGCGTGGSSALYGMALERLFPADFQPRSVFADADGSSLPDTWPISYDELLPWYIEAEKLYRVHGSHDPLRPAEANGHLLPAGKLTPANQELFAFLESRKLHPYQLHVGCESMQGCPNCQAFLCPRECKNEAGRICIRPAVEKHGATLLTECMTVAVEATRTEAKGLICRWKDRWITVRGKFIVLSAGALATPSILLNSRSAEWPNGVANSSSQVGRNYMRHMVDLYIVAPKHKGVIEGQIKEIAFNDFYYHDGRKYGTVQSFGELPPVDRVLHRPTPGWRHKAMRMGGPLFAPVWDRFRSRRLVFAAIMEDLPYSGNRVLPPVVAGNEFRIRLGYTMQPNEVARVAEFRRAVVDSFRPYRATILKGAAYNRAVAHSCGTCRFGDDPRTSVLDRHNRAHDLSNLYISDGSFFPSSGGINPALTIAANALRVARHLHSRL
jgi:choline dehydrogenase-like flavoprotein